METNSLAGFFFGVTDFVLVLFEPSSPHNSQRIDGNQQHNEDNTYYHLRMHGHTTKHNQTQPNTNYHKLSQHPFPAQIQAHFIPSGTRLAQLCQDSCFLHDANMFAKQGMSQSTGTLTLRQVRVVCTQREPTGRVIIVIVAEREKREDKRGKREEKEREEKENDGREKERREERKREKRTSSPRSSLPPLPFRPPRV